MVDAYECSQLNERRQALAVGTLADEHQPVGAGVMAHTKDAKWICKAVAVDLDGPLTEAHVAEISAWFRARDVAPVIELTSLSSEASLRAAADAGYQLVEVENVMAAVPQVFDIDAPEGITITRLDPANEAHLRRYAEIVSSGFVPEGETPTEATIESGVRSQRLPTSFGFLAFDGDEPIAASGAEIVAIDSGGDERERLLALCGTTVLPAYRRRGIQAAFMAARLRLGIEHGCAMVVVESKPGIPTERNAARLGFALAYTRLVLRMPLP